MLHHGLYEQVINNALTNQSVVGGHGLYETCNRARGCQMAAGQTARCVLRDAEQGTTTPSTKACSIGRAKAPRHRIRLQVSAISIMWSVAARYCCLSVSLGPTV